MSEINTSANISIQAVDLPAPSQPEIVEVSEEPKFIANNVIVQPPSPIEVEEKERETEKITRVIEREVETETIVRDVEEKVVLPPAPISFWQLHWDNPCNPFRYSEIITKYIQSMPICDICHRPHLCPHVEEACEYGKCKLKKCVHPIECYKSIMSKAHWVKGFAFKASASVDVEVVDEC